MVMYICVIAVCGEGATPVEITLDLNCGLTRKMPFDFRG